MFNGFRDFLLRGNVVELAVAVVIGAAFNEVVNGFITAFVDPLIAIALMFALEGDIRGVFAWAIVPAAIAVVLLVVGVEEPARPTGSAPVPLPVRWVEVRAIGAPKLQIAC